MTIYIQSIGKLSKNSEVIPLINEYAKRINYKIIVNEFDDSKIYSKIKNDTEIKQIKQKEAEYLLNKIPDNSFSIALDFNGKILTSEQFAEKINENLLNLGKDIIFFIGGPFGLDKKVLEKADLKLSFGKLTWPHTLVRAMLFEQIYRAQTIISNHPYHK